MTNDECKSEFRFEKRTYLTKKMCSNSQRKQLHIIDSNSMLQRSSALLKRVAYPCRYLDISPRFTSPVPAICVICNTVMRRLYQQWGFLLICFDREVLSPQIFKSMQLLFIIKVTIVKLLGIYRWNSRGHI